MTETKLSDPEIVSEIAHLDLVARETQLVQASSARARALRLASIGQTVAQDWVLHPADDGNTYCYLQDVGCQRVANLWGIIFEKTTLSDFVREDLPDENVRFEVMVTGRSIRTDLERTEIGSRSTTGFFAKQWRKAIAEKDEAAKAAILANVKKSALTNGHGRVVRAITGMGRMPIEELQAVLGDKAKRAGSVDYQKGNAGGSYQAGGASDAQLKKIAGMACYDGIVRGCERKDFNNVLDGIKLCRLTKKKASAVIEWLGKCSTEDDLPDKSAFKAEVGWPEKPASGNGGEGDGEKAKGSGDASS